MFDVTADEIAELSDTDLRELIGRLCEAELVSRGLSPDAVTWGGSQTAADGGLDVRVALPVGAGIDGFVPRPLTGFQVKTPDMPRTAILSEMMPKGTVRRVIQELAQAAGAYVIVSSRGSTSDSALSSRRQSMREALSGVTSADQLHTDFYDRTRLATWVRRHPGLITWVKEKVGRALSGWRPYGAWSGPAEGGEAEYLLDDKLRLHFGNCGDVPAKPVADAIDELRDQLALAGTMVRLVGLSGVGKTRFVQALFDARLGARPLPPSLAVYTNLSDNPDPQPVGLATDLIANRTRAVLVVDNCPPDLHRRLADLCAATGSTVSVITVEYDVRDDQPEGTQVVTLDTASLELIKKLISRRYSHLSDVDASSIADMSGGNARIAIALAETVGLSETIAGLTDEELFQRLFRQRHNPNDALLIAAQACSLVYSFQGEAIAGEEAELPRLAVLAGQTPAELYRHVGELFRRDLAQQRGVWRAILPHAVANRLAIRALEDTPYDLIDQQLVTGGSERLARSFSRRLSFLHDHPRAVAIVEKWLAVDGLLGNVLALNDLGRAMLENVAPVSPHAALRALERAGDSDPEASATVWWRNRWLLRSLAYDPSLFERSASLLARGVSQTNENHAKELSDTFVSLFPIYLSGTHATIEQRLRVVERLLRSEEGKQRSLGLTALDDVLEAVHFSSAHHFEFGARSRDYGYRPATNQEVTRWYRAALTFIERLAFVEGRLKPELRNLVARNFRGLWSWAQMCTELEDLSRKFTTDSFWPQGWAACRQTMSFDRDRLAPECFSRLSALEADLRPSNLSGQVRAVVLSGQSGGPDLDDLDVDGDAKSEFERLEATARKLGASVAADEEAFADLLPDVIRGGKRVWAFGSGLISASPDRRATWARLTDELKLLPLEQRDAQVLRGVLAELWDQDRELAQTFLDEALDEPALAPFLPALQSAVQFDARGVERLKQALRSGAAPLWMYRHLAYGRATDDLTGRDFKDLLMLIIDQPDGFDVALEVLHMRLFSDNSARRPHETDILDAGRELLRRVTFKKNNQHSDYHLAEIVRTCLADSGTAPIAAEVATRLKQAVAAFETYAFDNDDLLAALLHVQPAAVLDALFPEGDEEDQRSGFGVFDHPSDYRANPFDAISCDALIGWCDIDSERRYELAASIVSFASRAQEPAPPVWSEQAKALLSNAPDPKKVLAVLVERFRPMSWSGSRAALMEANACLLDTLDPVISDKLIPFLVEAKRQLVQEVARERRWETERDRARDERFE